MYAGISGSAFTFTIAEAVVPSAPATLNISATSQSTIQLTWDLPFNGYSPLLGYTLYTWREACGLDTCAAGVHGAWDAGKAIDKGPLSTG